MAVRAPTPIRSTEGLTKGAMYLATSELESLITRLTITPVAQGAERLTSVQQQR